MPRRSHITSLHHDRGRIAPEVRRAPRTGYDPHNPGMWPRLDWVTRSALERYVRGMPWSDHLLLAAVILAAHQWPAWRILATLSVLHGHLLTLFRSDAFAEIQEWDVDGQYEDDMWSGRWSGRDRELRVAFWEQYQDVCRELLQWFEQLTDAERRNYQVFLLPIPSLSRET